MSCWWGHDYTWVIHDCAIVIMICMILCAIMVNAGVNRHCLWQKKVPNCSANFNRIEISWAVWTHSCLIWGSPKCGHGLNISNSADKHSQPESFFSQYVSWSHTGWGFLPVFMPVSKFYAPCFKVCCICSQNDWASMSAYLEAPLAKIPL